MDLQLNFTTEGDTVIAPGDAYTAYLVTMIQMGVPREEIVAQLPYLRLHKYSSRVQFPNFALAWDSGKRGTVTVYPIQACDHIKVDFVIDKDRAFAKGDKPCQ